MARSQPESGAIPAPGEVLEHAAAERAWARLSGSENVPDPTFMLAVGRPGTRKRFRFVAVNSSYRAHITRFGISGDGEFVGRTPTDVLPPEMAGFAIERYEQVASTGEALTYTAGLSADDGVGFDVSLEPIFDARGRCTHILGIGHDLSHADEETALRASEKRFAALVEHSSDMVTVLDADGRIIYGSPAVRRVLGWPSGAFPRPHEPHVPPITAFDLLHPDDVERARRSLVDGVQQQRTQHRDEFRLLHADGSWVWVEAAATNLLDDPAVRGIVVNARDITERKRAEDEARASQRYFQTLVEHASEFVSVLDDQGLYVYASPAAARFMGREPDDLVGTERTDIVHPEDRDRMFEQLLRLRGGGPSAQERFMCRLRRFDGEYRHFECVASLLDDDLQGGYLVVNARDVTERVQSEEALRESEERFRSAFEHAPIGMALATADGRILRSNQAYARMLGRTPEAIAGMTVRDVTHPDDWEENDDRIRRLFAGEISGYQMEKRYVHASGKTVWVSLSVSAVRDTDGTPIYMIGQTEDVTERKAVSERLAHQAVHDPLTGLPNRTSFLDRLGLALDEAHTRRRRVGVLFLDLDHFKVINDSLGHEAGDQLLVTIGHRLRGILRPTDTVARFGGDEFTVLCEDVVDPASVMQLAQRVLEEIARPILLTEGEVFVTTSIGIACSGDQPETPNTLVRDADTAMYRAKDNGRARADFFDERVRERTIEHLHTGNALHRALDRGEFKVLYQPILELETGRVTGFEALLRWEHPERGLLGPIEFIGLAEETGLIVPIGAWVLDTACAQAACWRAARSDGPELTMSVNLSPRQLAEPSLPNHVAHTLQRHHVDPGSLWLEITETALMHDTESAASALSVLRAEGIHLTVDDFGTGYSSLTHLKRFPIEALKIDQSFVRGLARDPEDTAIVTAVVSLAHALGLVSTAEGVETPEQLAELRVLGCELAQGHLFATPATPEQLTDDPAEHLGPWAHLTS